MSFKPERIFLIVGLLMGLILLAVIPPFQNPDGFNHYYKAYQIAEGKIKSIKISENKVGGYLPASIVETALDISDGIRGDPDKKQDLHRLFQNLRRPLDPDRRIFQPFPNTALYSPIPYLPQAMGILIGRIFRLSPLAGVYLGRLLNFAVWLLLCCWAVSLTPVMKWVFCLIGLMPMTIAQAVTLSVDGLVISLSLLSAAFLFYLVYKARPYFHPRNVTVLLLLVILLALSKSVFVVIFGLFLMIDYRESKKEFLWLCGAICLAGGLAVLLWNFYVHDLYFPIREGTSVPKQMHFVFYNSFHFLKGIWITTIHKGKWILEMMVGVLGWSDTRLPGIIWLTYPPALVLAALTRSDEDPAPGLKQKIIAGLILIAGYTAVFLALYLDWTPIGKLYIRGIQGRYFIPLLPLFLFLIPNRKVRLRSRSWPVIFTVFSCLVLLVTVVTLIKRYYTG